MRIICLIVLLLSGAFQALSAQEILREQFPNGLTLIVRENHLTPAVSMIFAVNAGPRYEGALLGSGASELLRRLKSQVLPAPLAELVQRSGYRLSGHCSVAYTAYTIETTQEHINGALQSFAGIAMNHSYDQAAFDRQRNNLLNSQQHRDHSIDHQIDIALHRAFYRQPSQVASVSGESLPLQRLSLEALRGYDQERYVTGNMTLVIDGNVSTHVVKNAVAAYFAQVPQGFTADQLPSDEPLMLASRSLNIESSAAEPQLVLAWRTTTQQNTDQAILSVIAAYLNAANSPLRDALIGHQLAESLLVRHQNTLGAPGYLEIRIGLRGEDTQQVMAVVGDCLAQLQEHLLDPEQIQHIQKQLLREDLMSEQSTLENSEALLRWEVETGVPGFGEQMRAVRQQVHAEHIQKAALQYFRSTRSCKLTVKPPAIETIGADPAVLPQAITTVPPSVQELSNAVTVIERPLPIGLAHIVLSLGVDFSDDRLRGINELLARMITVRTATRSAQDLRAVLAEKGMRLQAFNSSDSLQLRVTCFPEDALFAMGLLVDCVTRPNFQEVDVEVYRQQLIEQIAGQAHAQSWTAALQRQVLDTLFADHYVSYTRYGSADTLKDIDVSTLYEHLQHLVHGPNVVVSLYGSYDADKASSFLKQHLSGARLFTAGERLQPQGAAWPAFKSISGSMSGDVDALAMVWHAPAIADTLRDKVAMDVLVALIGGVDGRGGVMAEINHQQDRDLIIESQMSTAAYDKRGIWLWMLRVEPNQSGAVRDLINEAIKTALASVALPKNIDTERALYRAKQICKTSHLLQDKDQSQAILDQADIILRESNLASVTQYDALLSVIDVADIRRVSERYVHEVAYILQMAPERTGSVKVGEQPAAQPVTQPVRVPVEQAVQPAQPIQSPVESEQGKSVTPSEPAKLIEPRRSDAQPVTP